PDPGAGVSLVVTDLNWEGNFLPVYFFAGYTYGPGQVQIIENPTLGFCGTANVNNVEFSIAADFRGALGVGGTAGKHVCPPTIIPGACCFDGGNTCQVLLRAECVGMGGHFKGEDTVCAPNPCPTTWACCIGSLCFMLSEDECVNEQGGRWLVDRLCSGVVCADLHVCCLPGNSCVYLTAAECAGAGGAYVTDPLFQSCDPNPCPVSVEGASWGTIKSLYR
ncbi:MAG: hypothetical protein FJY75_14115, partial [Candidatus Eisenbacteria bacterium]|nr:hypothetical protein [Candidatus Eisenbacteria bacterium]